MSNIKINDVFQRIQYAATNGQTQFSIPFPFFSNAYVVVWQDGVVINQGAGAGEYGITGAGSPSGGTITLVTPATLDSIITIEGVMPIDRTSIYSATISNLTGSDLNGDFNREVVMMKQIQTTQALLQLQYAPWAEISQDPDVTTDRYIPLLPPLGAWRMNAGGTAIETFLTPTSGTLAPGDATYIVQTADADLPNAQAMGALATGLVVNTTTTGVQLTRLLAGVTNQIAITNASGLAGNPTVGIASNPTIPGTEYILLPSGTTAQRPGSPSDGMVRYNTTLQALEVYEGSSWDALAGGIVDTITGYANEISIDNTDPQNPIIRLANNVILPGTGGETLPTGTTAQRAGGAGTMRFNSQTLEFEGTTDGIAWNSFQTSAGTILSVTGTANQVNVTAGVNPVVSLSSTMNLPGTFNIQSSTAINGIINDSTLATATASNIATAAALKTYIDNIAQGLNVQGSCVCASTTALTATYANGTAGVGATLTNAGAFAAIQLDGVSPTVGQRVLIKNQASSLQNGIYTVTTVGDGVSVNWVLTRATDFDTPSEIQPGDLVVITGGTTQNQSSWLQTATVSAVGTDAITFVQFTASLPVIVPNGGTGATSFTAYAPIVGGTTTTGALQSVGLGAAGTLFQSAGVGALPSFTTTTYPTTNAINTIMYASSANVLGVVTPTNNGVLVYSAGGVPSSSTTLPSGLTIPGYATTAASVSSITGTANQVIASASTGAVTLSLPQSIATSSSVQFNSVRLTSGILDANNAALLSQTSTASAVNYITIANAATGNAPRFTAIGSDTNVLLGLYGKGNAGCYLQGTSTNSSAIAGSVGEYISNSATITTITANTQTNLTSISLTAGDWDVSGSYTTAPAAGTTTNYSQGGISTTSAALPANNTFGGARIATTSSGYPVPTTRISISATTTVYLVGLVQFATSTMNMTGYISARRVR